VVTGGNKGIGLGIVHALVQHGATVTLWGRNRDDNKKVIENLKMNNTSIECFALECDVREEEQVKLMMNESVKLMGDIDCCIANAGVMGSQAPFVKYSSKYFEETIKTNLFGTFYTIKAASSQMIKSGKGGSLVAVSSIAGDVGVPGNPPYGISKGGIDSFMKGLSVELARYKIRSNIIKPGWTKSDMTNTMLDSESFNSKVLPRIPLRRWGEPEDFGGIAVYLASDASSYHTGDTITIDGGYTKF